MKDFIQYVEVLYPVSSHTLTSSIGTSILHCHQVDLLALRTVDTVIIQPRSSTTRPQWVTSFQLSYGYNNTHWSYVRSVATGDVITFDGNNPVVTTREISLPVPVTARYFRLHPRTWYEHISMRWGLKGCDYGVYSSIVSTYNVCSSICSVSSVFHVD